MLNSSAGKNCDNINECANVISACSQNEDCSDTDGSYTCTCKYGYERIGENCQDINECTDHTHTCDQYSLK